MSDNKNLKPGWKVWRFDQMATNVNVRIDNPSESGMEHYVGLEHLDADSLKIRRWGTPDDVEATKLMFKKGDIIFGRRRAYQRKLGVAEFDGICSAHAMVLRAKPDVVLPEFLPFFMQSDLFMNRAVEISVGSLSPTINWKTMAVQEFALPPMDEQQRLVEVLSSAISVFDSESIAIEASWNLLRSLLVATFDTGADPLRCAVHKQWACQPLSRFISVKHGWAFKGDFFSEESSSGPQLLIPGNFTEFGWFDFSSGRNKYYTGEFPADYRLLQGDLLLLMTDLTPSAKLLGAPGMVESGSPLLHNQRLGKVVVHEFIGHNEKLFKEYLHFFFMSEVFRRQVRAQSAGSTVSHSSPTQICRIALPCPSDDEIESVLSPLRSARDALLTLKSRVNGAARLASALRQAYLEEG